MKATAEQRAFLEDVFYAYLESEFADNPLFLLKDIVKKFWLEEVSLILLETPFLELSYIESFRICLKVYYAFFEDVGALEKQLTIWDMIA